MRILLVADPMVPVPPKHYGGIERIIDMLCREYFQLGHQVTLLAHPQSSSAGELVPLSALNPFSTWAAARNALALARLVWKRRIDIVHSFGRLAQLLPLLPLSVPKMMSYQREPHLPGIARAHRLARHGSLLFTGCSDYITRQIATCAAAATVYNGVPIDRYAFQPAVAHDAPLVFLGRIEHIKGVHNAIEIAKATGRPLIIAGNIPDEPQHLDYFAECIKPQLNERIQYIGPVDDRTKNELLGRALALVMAVEWNEPFGIVMAEALACGTPVLGARRGAVPEVVVDGEHGYVRDRLSDLVACVEQLKLIDRAACRQRCDQLFSGGAIAAGYLRCYEQLMAGDIPGIRYA